MSVQRSGQGSLVTKFTIANTRAMWGEDNHAHESVLREVDKHAYSPQFVAGIVESFESGVLDLIERQKAAVKSEDWNRNRTNQACDRGYLYGAVVRLPSQGSRVT